MRLDLMMAVLVAGLVAGCASAPAAAPTAVASAATAGPSGPSAGPEKICKNLPVMGSNFPKKVCSTKDEWAEFDRKTHESVDSFDNDRRSGNTQGQFEPPL